MAVSTGKKVALVAILAVGYFIGGGENEHQRYEELKKKDATELTLEEKKFISKVENERSKVELERKKHQIEQDKKRESEKPKPLSEQVLLQNDVIFSCESTARSMLQYPDSYEVENRKSGIDIKNGESIYYFTLDYSGVNAFNVRSNHVIECYGTVGDPSHKVTYRTFN